MNDLAETLERLPYWIGGAFSWQVAFADWVILSLLPLAVLWAAARVLSWRHGRSLTAREAEAGRPPVVNLRTAPEGYGEAGLIVANVVVGHAAVRSLPIAWAKLVGGRVGVLERMMVRARREALLRLQDAAAARGADLVLNVRFATHGIGIGGAGALGMEVVAFATAVVRSHRRADQSPASGHS